MHQLGFAHAVTVKTTGTHIIKRWINRFSYAKSGNADRPTPNYTWTVLTSTGMIIGNASSRKAAEELIS